MLGEYRFVLRCHLCVDWVIMREVWLIEMLAC
jgi:hypothetical protein